MTTLSLRKLVASLEHSTKSLLGIRERRRKTAQTAPSIEPLESRQMLTAIPAWVNTIGTLQGVSSQFSSNYINDVAIDNEENVYAIGSFRGTFDFDPGTGVNKLTATYQGGDAFIAKYNAKGGLEWVRQFAGIGADQFASSRGVSIHLGDDGGIYVGGTFSGKLTVDFGDGTTNLTSLGGQDIFVAKLTQNADLSYIKQMGSSGNDSISEFVDAGDNSFAIRGSTDGVLDLDFNGGTVNITPPASTTSGFISFYSTQADTLDYFTHGSVRVNNTSDFTDFSSGFLIDSKGQLLLAGYFRGTAELLDSNNKVITTFTSGPNNEAFLVNLDVSPTSTTLNWSKTFASDDFISAGPVTATSDGQVFFGLNITGKVDLDPGTGTKFVSVGKHFSPTIVSLDDDGSFLGGHTIGGSEGEIRNIGVTSDNEVIASGYFMGSVQFDPSGSAAGKYNAAQPSGFVWVLNAEGKFLDAAGFYSAKGGTNKHLQGYADVRAMGINDDGNVAIGGVFHGTVDFNPTTVAQKVTSISDGFADDAFVLLFGDKHGTADRGSASAPVASTDTFTPGKNLTIVDSNNNKVTLSISGTGTGVITRTGSGDIDTITITGSKSTSNLNITVSGTANGGTTNVGAILVGVDGDGATDAIGTINAAKVNLFDGLTIEGTANGVTLNNLSSLDIKIGGGPANGTNLKFANVTDVSIQTGGVLSGLDVQSWLDTNEMKDVIISSRLGKLNAKSGFQADLQLAGTPGSTLPTLGSASIGGVLSNVNWDINGNTGAFKFDGLDNVAISADKVQGFTVGKNGINKLDFDALSVGAVNIAGAVNLANFSLNTSRPVTQPANFSALTSFSVAGGVSNLNLSASGANSKFGNVTFKGNVDKANISTTGALGGVSGTSGININIDALAIGAVSFSGNVDSASIKGESVRSLAVRGNINDTGILIVTGASKSYSAFGSVNITGNTTGLSILATNPNAKFGALNFGKTVDTVLIQAAGEIASIKGGSVFGLDVTSSGKLGSLTATSLTNSSLDVLSIGNATVSGALSKSSFTLNTDQAPQAKTFKAFGNITVNGPANNVSITAVGNNSNGGAINFNKGLTGGLVDINGSVTSLNSAGLSVFNGNIELLGTLNVRGALTNASLTSDQMKSVTINGSVDGFNLTLNANGDPSANNKAVGNIQVNGNASNLNITASGSNSSVGNINVTGAVSQAQISINGSATRIAGKSIDEGSSISVAGKLSTLSTGLKGDMDGFITAGAFGSVTVGGNLMAEVVGLTNLGIGAVNVTGTISNALIRTPGSITSITTQGIFDTAILSGYNASLPDPTALPTTSAGFNNSAARIGAVTIRATGSAASFARSAIMGVSLGSISLKVVNTDNDGQDFGVTAVTRIDSLTRTGAAPLKGLTGPGEKARSGDFVVRIVTPA